MSHWISFGLGLWAGTCLGAGILLFFAAARTPNLNEDQ